MNDEHTQTADSAHDELLSLQEASDLLGVAASTVRRWADAGRLPMKRTLGGHRRFVRAAVEHMARTVPPERAPAPPEPTGSADEQALESREWHTRLASRSDSQRMRELGQRLLGVLLQYMNRRDESDRFLAEGRDVGAHYGAEARAAGISMYDTVEAFLMFRNVHAQYAVPLPTVTHMDELAEWMDLHTRMNHFMDVLLLGVVAGYEGRSVSAPAIA